MKDSMKKALLTLASMIFAGLTLVFFAVPNIYIGDGENTLEWSGFDFYERGTDFMKAMLIITCIFVGLTILLGIVKILTDSKLVSNKKVSKIINTLFIISALGTLIFAVLYCISVGARCADTTIDSGILDDWFGIGDVETFKPTIWALVLMSIFGALSFLSGLFSLSSNGKKKKK